MSNRLDLSRVKAKLRELLPSHWTAKIGAGMLGIGYDQATTENELSNPASVTVTERAAGLFTQRLVMRFKSADYRVRLALLELVIDDIHEAGKRPRRLVIDATSEKSAAQQARDQFSGRCPVEEYVASKNIVYRKQKYLAKTLISDQYRQTFEDNCSILPAGDWIIADHQLVKVQGGRYEIEEDSSGNHGDSWVSGSLSYWALMSKQERVELVAVNIAEGSDRQARSQRPGLHDIFKRQTRKGGRLLA